MKTVLNWVPVGLAYRLSVLMSSGSISISENTFIAVIRLPLNHSPLLGRLKADEISQKH